MECVRLHGRWKLLAWDTYVRGWEKLAPSKLGNLVRPGPTSPAETSLVRVGRSHSLHSPLEGLRPEGGRAGNRRALRSRASLQLTLLLTLLADQAVDVCPGNRSDRRRGGGRRRVKTRSGFLARAYRTPIRTSTCAVKVSGAEVGQMLHGRGEAGAGDLLFSPRGCARSGCRAAPSALFRRAIRSTSRARRVSSRQEVVRNKP
jgi:hypothetical protein